MNEGLQIEMSLEDYMDLRMKHLPKKDHHLGLKKKIGKLNLPYFNGSSETTTHAWVQKVDTYFQFNPMTKEEAIKFAALHLDGLAHEWWYHSMITMDDTQITSYMDFIERLIKRLNNKDPELYFKELAQLKQEGSIEEFIRNFQRLSVLVTDISIKRLVVLFVDGLKDPLRGWVKSLNASTPQEAIKKA